MMCSIEAATTTVWPCKTREQPQRAVTALARRDGNAMQWHAVAAHQLQLLGPPPAGVLLHHAGSWFKFRDDAATFAAGIWIVFHGGHSFLYHIIGTQLVSMNRNTPRQEGHGAC